MNWVSALEEVPTPGLTVRIGYNAMYMKYRALRIRQADLCMCLDQFQWAGNRHGRLPLRASLRLIARTGPRNFRTTQAANDQL